MAAETVFVSPGIYTKDQDFTFFASRVGVTKLGLVGLTLKGPAFEPIKVSSTDQFFARFGGTDTTLALPYVAQAFLKQSSELTVTRVLGQTGFLNSSAFVITVGSGSANTLTNTMVAVLRSKSPDGGSTFYYNNASDIQIYGYTSPLANFSISASTGPLTAFTNNSVTVCLDESSTNYIVKAIGKNPLRQDGDYGIYVESIFPHFLREAVQRGVITGITSTFVKTNDPVFTDYQGGYTNSVTPWIVGRVAGSAVRNLFKIETISDGNASAKEVKISFANIDPDNNTFDVIVRNFYDTDANTATSGRLEMFRQLTMDDSQPNFIGRAIGTTNEDYPARSKYITITMADNFATNTVPAGFRGYELKSLAASSIAAPQLYYKTQYLSGDTDSKTYLGLSETAYTGLTSSIVGIKNSVQSLEGDIFAYQGHSTAASGHTTIKGFHMESGAPSSEFELSPYASMTGFTKSQRKFTVAPAGGFDGWNKFKEVTFVDGTDLDNIDSFKDAIDMMAAPEAIDINIFATPGVNFESNLVVVNHALEMVETRADSLYVIDAPRISTSAQKGTATEVVDLLASTGIDSNCACTYWPWIQINDAASSKYVYIAPTGEAIKSMALTDNVSYPWFVPGGKNRGQVQCERADVRLTRDDRDVLYEGRVNPINTTVQDGVLIWGQKTLQIKQSALDRINIKRLILQVRRLIAAAAITLVFEQNDQTTRDQFLAKVQPLLLQIQNQRGLAAFRVAVEDASGAGNVDSETLIGKIQLKPTPALEFVDLTFQVLPTGANFADF